MIIDLFHHFIEDLYALYHQPLPEELGESVTIKIASAPGIVLTMQSDPQGLLIISELGRLPGVGRRQPWLVAALSWNLNLEHRGVLALNPSLNLLLLSRFFPLQDLRAHLVYEIIKPFSEEALEWKNACDRGVVPSWKEEKVAGSDWSPFKI